MQTLRRPVKAVLQGLSVYEVRGKSPSLGLFPEMSPALQCHRDATSLMLVKSQQAVKRTGCPQSAPSLLRHTVTVPPSPHLSDEANNPPVPHLFVGSLRELMLPTHSEVLAMTGAFSRALLMLAKGLGSHLGGIMCVVLSAE